MNEPLIDRIAWTTAQDLLKRHAPDLPEGPGRAGLCAAIARLARQGIESSVRLYQAGLQGTEAPFAGLGERAR